MAITANSIYKITELDLTINEKIIPDGTKWTNSTSVKLLNDGTKVGDLFKADAKINGDGNVEWVTIHNTEDIGSVSDDAAQYTLATYNQNMGWTRVHFYVDNISIWQNLKAGLGLCLKDPVGSAEIGFHAGDGNGSTSGSGNRTSLAIECIMNENAASDEKAKDNCARLAALLLFQHGLGIEKLVTHTYWVNKAAGKTFSDVDKQCTNMISGKKWCPCYIFNSTNATTALNNWKAFKKLVSSYLAILEKGKQAQTGSSTTEADSSSGDILYRIQVGAFKVKSNATNYLKTVQAAGFTNAFVQEDKASTGTMYRVQVGAYRVKANADNYLKTVKVKFPDAYVAYVYASDKIVNSPTLKSIDEIAQEVLAGKWGNGQERIDNLKKAGYDYKEVQEAVNKLLK